MADNKANVVVPDPFTRLPRQRVRTPDTPPVKAPGPATTPAPGPRPGLSLNSVLLWITTCDDPDKVYSFLPAWQAVQKKLAEFGVRPNKSALSALPTATDSVTINGRDLNNWIATATKDDVETLQKLHAAMRLRWRHAAWLKKRRG